MPVSKSTSKAALEPITEPVIVPVKKQSRVKRFFRAYFPWITLVVVIGLTLTTIYFYKQSAGNTAQASQTEVRTLVKKVGKLVVLPEGETPTVATVSDPEALKDQAFFAEAKKGDKVLIYSAAKKAILYDPVANKVITIAPLNIDASATATKPSTATPTTPN